MTARNERIYELTVIASSSLDEGGVNGVVEEITGYLKDKGASVEDVERWGRKRLAYEIEKQNEGWYLLFHVNGSAEGIEEAERRMRISDKYLRYMSVRIDNVAGALESKKNRRVRLEKQEQERAARAAAKAEQEAAKAAEEAAKEAAKAAEAESKAAAEAEAKASAEESPSEAPANADEGGSDAPAEEATS